MADHCWLCSGRGARGASCGRCLKLIPDRPLMILAGNVIVLLSLRRLIQAVGQQDIAGWESKRCPLKA
jgi:hypothetical protein